MAALGHGLTLQHPDVEPEPLRQLHHLREHVAVRDRDVLLW